MDIRIRPATTADLGAIRDLQIESWRGAYAGMLPDTFLRDSVVDVLAERWKALPGDGWIVDTAWAGDRLVGFVTVDRAKGPGAYVDNLHVASDTKGSGVGRKLMAGAAATLAAEGVDRLWLTVIDQNTPARAFYRRIGGRELTAFDELLYGQPVTAIPVEWNDLKALAAQHGPSKGATPGQTDRATSG